MDDGHSPAAGVAVFVDRVGWDMDGTLIDSVREVPAAFVRAVAALAALRGVGLPMVVFTGASGRSGV